jgi:hypothetical protein
VSYASGAPDVVTALSAHGASTAVAANFLVNENGPGNFTVAFQGGLVNQAIAAMTSPGNTLQVPIGLAGTMNLNTTGVLNLMAGSIIDVTTNLQIRTFVGGVMTTIAYRDDSVFRPNLEPNPNGGSPGLVITGVWHRVKADGTLQLKDVADGLYYTIRLNTGAFDVPFAGEA